MYVYAYVYIVNHLFNPSKLIQTYPTRLKPELTRTWDLYTEISEQKKINWAKSSDYLNMDTVTLTDFLLIWKSVVLAKFEMVAASI